jgi:hypothetical protein
MTFTETYTATQTVTYTETQTETPTYTGTDTITCTVTATVTETVTETERATVTATATVTRTPTITRTRTATPVYSATGTYTFIPTYTVTPTVTTISTPVLHVAVYPNPCNRERAVGGSVKFEVPSTADIHIYNIETYKVFEAKSATGRVEWNCTNIKGEKVAPGVYLYIVEMAGETVRGKLFITK